MSIVSWLLIVAGLLLLVPVLIFAFQILVAFPGDRKSVV